MFKHINNMVFQLKQVRQTQGVSQQLLADKVGMPQSHISRIEQGSVNLKLASFLEIARALGLEVMLVPRQNVTAVNAILSSGKRDHSHSIRPAYILDDSDEEEVDE